MKSNSKSGTNSEHLFEILKFIAVGAINTVIDLAVLNFLIAIFHTGRSGASFGLFKSISFLAALVNSYILNRAWTFAGAAAQKRRHIEFGQFLAVSLIGLAVNVAAATAFVSAVHPVASLERFWPSIAALVGTAFGLIWNYIGYKYFVFVKKDTELLPPA